MREIMVFYSGASEQKYRNMEILSKKFPENSYPVWCYDSETFGIEMAVGDAIGFAHKRVRQDNSEMVVIEITKPEDFVIEKKHGIEYVLIGVLNPNNHVVHRDIEELKRSANIPVSTN